MQIIIIFKENNQKIGILKNLENGPSTLSQLHIEGWNCVYFELLYSVNIKRQVCSNYILMLFGHFSNIKSEWKIHLLVAQFSAKRRQSIC